MVAVFFVDPERRREVSRAVERGDDVFDNLLLGQSDLRSFHPIDVDVDLRRVEPLLDAHIDGAGHAFRVAPDFFRDLVRDFEFVAFDLDVDRRGQTGVEGRA